MKDVEREFEVGDHVLVPWGSDEVSATVVETWGDPPSHVRVRLDELTDAEDPSAAPIILLTPSIVRPQAA